MSRLLLTIAVACLFLMLVAVPALAAQTPITSAAELTRYLHDTPAGTSPLDQLSPGGRKRFLAQLDFGDHGVRGFSLSDPQNELTHQQIVQLLTLFGLEEYASDEGLTPASQHRIKHERIADAAARGCTIATCAESNIEQRYDELVLEKPDPSIPDAERFARIGQHYDQLFASDQLPARMHSTSSPDLRLLKRATDQALFAVPDTAHIAQLQRNLAEMQQRDMVDDVDFQSLYNALLVSRQFASAEDLARQHPGMAVDTVPILRKSEAAPHGWPTALTVAAQGRTMMREAIDLSTPLRIVVVASCHFSEDAARAVESDAQLRPLFARHAIWIASQRESIHSVTDWNHKFQDQPIRLAWQDSEWSMLDSWAMPTFYVFRNGHLISKFSGWHDLATLKQSLREAGALH